MKIGMATKLRIINLCKDRNITINKLSILCGVTQSTFNSILNRENNTITLSTIKKICDGLDITIKEFFDSEEFDNLEQEIE